MLACYIPESGLVPADGLHCCLLGLVWVHCRRWSRAACLAQQIIELCSTATAEICYSGDRWQLMWPAMRSAAIAPVAVTAALSLVAVCSHMALC
jgi:hypothetical protein